jgi:hypothetical protein
MNEVFNLTSMRIPISSQDQRIEDIYEKIKSNLDDRVRSYSGDITLQELIDTLEKNRIHVIPGGYHWYMQSKQWSLKSQAMRKYFKTCAICNSTKRLCVHHKHYNNVGRESLQDLTVLCGDHHWEYEEKRIKAKENEDKKPRS